MDVRIGKEKVCLCCGSKNIQQRGTRAMHSDGTISQHTRDMCVDCLSKMCQCKGEKVQNKEKIDFDRKPIDDQSKS